MNYIGTITNLPADTDNVELTFDGGPEAAVALVLFTNTYS